MNSNRAYDYAVIVFFALLAYINVDAADYSTIYLPMYLNPTNITDIDPGWSLLCQAGSAMELSYNGFALVIAVAAMTLTHLYARRVSTNSSLMMALFLIYPGPMALVQFRQWLAMCIVAVGSTKLYSGKRESVVSYVVFVLVAFLVHRSAIVFLILGFIPSLQRFFRDKSIILIVLVVFLYCSILPHTEELSTKLFGTIKTTAYLYGQTHMTSFLGGIRNVLFTVLMFLLVYKCRTILDVERTSSIDLILHKSVPTILYVQLVMIAFIPFMLISNDFMRFERYAFFMALPVFASMSSVSHRHKLFSCKAFWVLVCVAFAYEFVVKGTFDTVYIPLLSFEYFPPLFL